MYATDFEYDGYTLSDFGMTICSFQSAGLETVSSGADLSFQTVKPSGSDKFRFYGSGYEESFTATIQICKSPCGGTGFYPEPSEISALQRWLCRKDGYHPFHVIQEDLKDIFWNAAFTCRQLVFNGRTAGLELMLYTDAPYAYLKSEPVSCSLTPGDSFSLFDQSDETGSIYPTVEILCKGQGDIRLTNSMDRKILTLTSLSFNERITLDGEHKIITSSLQRKDLPDHFNFYFPRIRNTFRERENIFTLIGNDKAIPCDITFHYHPVIKTGL